MRELGSCSYALGIGKILQIGSNIAVKIRISAQFEPIVEGKLVLLSRLSERNVMTIETEILQVLHYHPLSNRGAIASMLVNAPSDSTMKRLLADAVSKGLIEVYGKGPATKYSLTPQAQVTMPLDIDTYFKNEMDDRTVQENFNFELIKQILPKVSLFTEEECKRLDKAQSTFRTHLEELSETDYKKEMERLGVDLSWKSSQIEGNTYSLLETERLLKERQEATGKTREEAIMLLNHKDALDFVLNVPDYLKEISVHRIEDIHSLLTKDLGVERNIRRRRVGITGTNYRLVPLITSSRFVRHWKIPVNLSMAKTISLRSHYLHWFSFLIFRHFRMETNVLPVSQAMPY